MVMSLKVQVVGGEYEGRLFWLEYVLEHRDPKKQERGQRAFAALRRATGVLQPKDTEELHFKWFGVKMGVKARKDTGEMENVIREYLFAGCEGV